MGVFFVQVVANYPFEYLKLYDRHSFNGILSNLDTPYLTVSF